MDSLELNKQIFTWINIYLVEKHDKKSLYRSITIAIMSVEFVALISSVWFIVENIKSDFEHCLYALFQTAALISSIYIWTIGFIQRDKIADIFMKLKDIRKLCKFSTLKFYLENS